MDTRETALKLHAQGNNCAQAILGAFANNVDMDIESALKIGSGLGGGIGRSQNICGAVNAGAIIIGLKHSSGKPGDIESKEKVSEIAGKFVEECKKELGSVQCKELLKINLLNPTEKLSAKESGLFDKVCNNAIIQTARILEKYLEDEV